MGGFLMARPGSVVTALESRRFASENPVSLPVGRATTACQDRPVASVHELSNPQAHCLALVGRWFERVRHRYVRPLGKEVQLDLRMKSARRLTENAAVLLAPSHLRIGVLKLLITHGSVTSQQLVEPRPRDR
ncbi:MAG: hypothetical protein ABI206_05890 [Antricoccus sp.]